MNLTDDYIMCIFRNIFPEDLYVIKDRLPDDQVANIEPISFPYRQDIRLAQGTDRYLVILPNDAKPVVLKPGNRYTIRPGIGPNRTEYRAYSVQQNIRNVNFQIHTQLPIKVSNPYETLHDNYESVRDSLGLPEVNFLGLPLYFKATVNIRADFQIFDPVLFLSYCCKWENFSYENFSSVIEIIFRFGVVLEKILNEKEIDYKQIENSYGSIQLNDNNVRTNIYNVINNWCKNVGVRMSNNICLSITQDKGLPNDLIEFNQKAKSLADAVNSAIINYKSSECYEVIMRDTNRRMEQRRDYVREFVNALLQNQEAVDMLLQNRALATSLIQRAQMGNVSEDVKNLIKDLRQNQDTLI